MLAVGGWLAGFAAFVAALPGEVAQPQRHTDAIVVLTGGSGRVDEGLALLAEGRAERLFVSGVYRGVQVPELLQVAQGASEHLACCVALGYEAESTRGNAEETAAWAAAHGISSLRLVTSAYHMPRSLLEFRRTMPEVEIVPHPVFAEHVRQDDWWRAPASANLLLREHAKYVVARLRVAVAG